MIYKRMTVVKQAKKWLGCKEGDKVHRHIIDLYNKNTNGYNMTYRDPWCACFVSAVAIACGYTKIIPTSVNCGDMLNKFKSLGCWVENDAYRPSPGDVIFYDWSDNGVGDNHGAPDHVGVVEKVSKNTITVIEGNKGTTKTCARSLVPINGQYVRGCGVPKYSKKAPIKPSTKPAKPAKKTVDELAKEVLAGKWGSGTTRKKKLEAAGYDYTAVQKKVNEILENK